MSSPAELTDTELRDELKALGFNAPPVTGMTRNTMEKKLQILRDKAAGIESSKKTPKGKRSPTKSTSSASRDSSASRTPPSRRSSSRGNREPQPTVVNESLNFDDDPAPVVTSPKRTTPTASKKVNVVPESVPRVIPPTPAESPVRTNRPVFKRTPTPTRPTLHKSREPVFRIDDEVFGHRIASQAEEDEDDHYETSRPLSPEEKRHFGSSRGQKQDSPLDKLKQFGSSAIGYLQKSGKKPQYVNHPSERGYFGTPGGRYSPVSPLKSHLREPSPSVASEIPKYILIFFMAFTTLLFVAYVFTAHSSTVEKGKAVIIGTVSDIGSLIYNYAIIPVIAAVLVIGVSTLLFYIYRRHKLSKLQLENKIRELADEISVKIRDGAGKGIKDDAIRDSIYPPTRISNDQKALYDKATTLLEASDTRIRVELRLVDGVETKLWFWNVPVADKYGSPFHRETLGVTRCLKIRDVPRVAAAQSIQKLQGEFNKLLESAKPILCEYRYSSETGQPPAMYLAFKSVRDSGEAFQILSRTSKFSCPLVVKYVTDQRFHERFPDLVFPVDPDEKKDLSYLYGSRNQLSDDNGGRW
ncbi:unnamed protein product [Bursaphelenchus okinawaensis]|uniref:LEM domain-containing protein n=1 Tax=Bursaphelenchus okinawaensis TaxID=465554 RepID=A0A811KV53_9BILA|nr:unnamed protein product [Bursaphelenchus okinawaensis]CAG9112446.1 unnamed protein product [Bursaphelenchus okinawaensis]